MFSNLRVCAVLSGMSIFVCRILTPDTAVGRMNSTLQLNRLQVLIIRPDASPIKWHCNRVQGKIHTTRTNLIRCRVEFIRPGGKSIICRAKSIQPDTSAIRCRVEFIRPNGNHPLIRENHPYNSKGIPRF